MRYIGLILALACSAAPAEDTLDLSSGWLFRPDPKDEGVASNWMSSELDESEWKPIRVGARWEDDGYRDYDGIGWYRIRFDAPADWAEGQSFLLLGGVNDSCRVYCNGELIDAFGDDINRTMYQTTIAAFLGKSLKPGASNVIAVRVFDWGGNGGLWRAPIRVVRDQRGLPWDELVHFRPDVVGKKMYVEFAAESFGNIALGNSVSVAMQMASASAALNAQSAATQQVSGAGAAAFAVEGPAENQRPHAAITFTLPDQSRMTAHVVGKPWPSKPQWPGDYATLDVANNFVTDLVDRQRGRSVDNDAHAFRNPRTGWVFISWHKEGVGEPPTAFLDDETSPLVWRRNPDSGAWEVMRHIAEGKHALRQLRPDGGTLSIRAIPEIAFCYYPYAHHVAAFGAPDAQFMEKHVLSHVNTIVARSDEVEKEPLFEQWRREGRQWIATGGVLGLKAPEPPDPKAVADTWLENRGVTSPAYAGLIVDEFTSETDAHYRAWTQSIQLLRDAPQMNGKQFYAWCVDLFRDPGPIEFSQKLKELDFVFSWEKYIREEPTLEIAERWINQSLGQSLEEWQRHVPGIEQNMIVCLGYFSAPPETLDVDPAVDYNVFLDMQFNMLANDPRFFGVRGVMEYLTNYADEEYLRYVQKLYRHYCIEGRRERMNNDPYMLPHVQNPDFANGLEAWTVEAAETGSVATNSMDGFSFLEGRYPRYKEGDQFCEMRRAAAANRVAQTVRRLTPGRLYSLKMYSANIEHLDQKEPSGLAIAIDNVELLDSYTFDFVFPSSYAHVVPPYDSSHPAHMTFHRRVFRATGDTATLVLTDEAAKPGNRTAFNFVQIQPYHAAE